VLDVNIILCPTDFSKHALKAVETAEQLCHYLSATLLLVHVLPPVPSSTPISSTIQSGPPGYKDPPSTVDLSIGEYIKELTVDAEKKLEDIKENKIKKDIEVEIEALNEGSEAEEINRLADERKVDMIVISTHGKTGLKEVFLGSVTEKVIRHAQKPVLTIQSEV